jgi:hypothetical protein
VLLPGLTPLVFAEPGAAGELELVASGGTDPGWPVATAGPQAYNAPAGLIFRESGSQGRPRT